MQPRLFLSATLLLALTMAACGGSSFTPPPPPGNGPFSNASLSGNYAFTMTGSDANGFFIRTGSLLADGKGNFTGVEDVNSVLGVFPAIPSSGTYSIGGDGRGTLTLMNATGTTTYRLTVISNTQAFIIQNDSFATASGNLTAQNTAAFNTGLSGNYAFDFSGVDSGGTNSLSIVGEFSANASQIQSPEEDVNDGGSPSQVGATAGNFTSVDPTTGRGTASLQSSLAGTNGTLTFVYYIVSPTQAFFMNTNQGAAPAVSGTVSKQQPPAGGFVPASFSGDYSLLISGSSTSGAIGDAARFHADGVSAITLGVLDENNNGVPSQNAAFGGAFTNIDPSGRGTMTFNFNTPATFVFYLISPQSAVIQETDSSIVSNGSIQMQTGGPFSNASLKSHFALNMTGTGKTQINVNPGRFDLIGDLAFDGAGNITGAEFTNDQSSVIIPGSASLTGTYSLGANGRGTMTLMFGGGTTLQFAIYVTDSSTINIQGTDMGAVIVGIASNQNF
jgi:hypothetical protein